MLRVRKKKQHLWNYFLFTRHLRVPSTPVQIESTIEALSGTGFLKKVTRSLINGDDQKSVLITTRQCYILNNALFNKYFIHNIVTV